MTVTIDRVARGEPIRAQTINDLIDVTEAQSLIGDNVSTGPTGSIIEDREELDSTDNFNQLFGLYDVFSPYIKIRGGGEEAHAVAIAGAYVSPSASGSGMSFDTKIDLSDESDGDLYVYLKIERAAGGTGSPQWSLEKGPWPTIGAEADYTEYKPLWKLSISSGAIEHTKTLDMRGSFHMLAMA